MKANKMTFEQLIAQANYESDKRHKEFEGQMRHYVKVSKEHDKTVERDDGAVDCCFI